MTGIVFHWDGEPRPDLEQRIIEELMGDMLCDTEGELRQSVDGLVCSTIVLTDDWEGPSISAYGKEGRIGEVWAAYHETTQWIPLGGTE